MEAEVRAILRDVVRAEPAADRLGSRVHQRFAAGRSAREWLTARRRYYKLTPLGRQVLDLESQRLKDLVRVLDARRRQEARS